MKPEPGLEHFPIWCEGCHRQGYIFAEHLWKEPYYVLCEACGWCSSIITCQNCGVGGALIEDIKDQPAEWTCQTCHTTYSLPRRIYDHPTRIYFEEESLSRFGWRCASKIASRVAGSARQSSC